MNLLLLLYAMVAGLAGINAGPSAVARMAAVAQGSVAGDAATPASQAEIAGRALIGRQTMARLLPVIAAPDARRVAAMPARMALPESGRAAPERRLE